MKDLKILRNFRQKLYDLLPKRRDATLDLIDALSSDFQSTSVTQLSLSPFLGGAMPRSRKSSMNFFVTTNESKERRVSRQSLR